MAWLAIDKDGIEYVYEEEPIKTETCYLFAYDHHDERYTESIRLPKGTIEKILGKKLSFEDGAIEI